MPSYIELDKQLSFPASSNVGKLILGVNSSKQATLTDSAGVTTVIGGGGELPYTSYVAKVAVYGDAGQEIHDRNLIVGQTYYISTEDLTADFSNVAEVLSGQLGKLHCVFRATGTTPANWGIARLTSYGNPVPVSIQENSLGFTTSGSWNIIEDGNYVFNFETPTDPSKVSTFFTPSGISVVNSYIREDAAAISGVNNKYLENLSSIYSQNGINSGSVLTTAKSLSGSILIGGNFTSVNGNEGFKALFRTYDSGYIDTNFTDNFRHNGGFSQNFPAVNVVKVQSDGKILVGGEFKGFNGNGSKTSLIRLNSDGTEDTTFYTNLVSSGDNKGFDGAVMGIDIQSDGKIIVGGNFWTLNGNSRIGLVRLNTDGTEDTTFYSNFISYGDQTGFESLKAITQVLVQPDDSFFIIHFAKKYGGFSFNSSVLKFNSEGILDSTFYTNYVSTGNHTGDQQSIYTIALQSDGKLLIGGDFTVINEIEYRYLARVRTTGMIDDSYVSQISGGGDGVTNIVVEGDHDITFVAGDITDYGNYGGTNRIVKLTKDAQLINAFDSFATIPLPTGNSLTLLPYNSLIMGLESSPWLTRLQAGNDAWFRTLNVNGESSNQFLPMQFEIRKYK